jgi:hypothetical protein
MHSYSLSFLDFYKMKMDYRLIFSLRELRRKMTKSFIGLVICLFSWVVPMIILLLLLNIWSLRGPPRDVVEMSIEVVGSSEK